MSRLVGQHYEQLAGEYLISQGYIIIGRNYTTKYGEIDLIAIKDDVLVFVEVKYRRSRTYGRAYEYVGAKKIAKIKRAAWHFIHSTKAPIPEDYRIDVVSIDGDDVTVYENVG